MISFIHFGSKKRVPGGNKLADMLERRWLAIWVHSNYLIENLTPLKMTQKFAYSVF